jgi:hypothetical protein
MPESQPNPAELAIQVGAGYIASISLNVAIELEIADRLAAGPRPVGELATEARADEDALYRVLRLLASLGIFSEGPARTFSTPTPPTCSSRVQRVRFAKSFGGSAIRFTSAPTPS